MRSWTKRARGASTLRSNTGLAKTKCQAEINQYIDVCILYTRLHDLAYNYVLLFPAAEAANLV